MSTSRHILLVEDDPRICAELIDALRGSGFEVTAARNLVDGLAALSLRTDLVLLDLGLPDGDGLELCRRLREQSYGLPVIILTARDGPEEKVRGLDVGADDYVVKPFHTPELLARIRSVLRRTEGSAGRGVLKLGSLWLDPVSRSAGKNTTPLHLKRREFDLLSFLMRFPERPWSRAQLLDRVWGLAFDGDPRTVDIHVRRLRQQIEQDPSSPRILVTEWGIGYRLQGTTDE